MEMAYRESLGSVLNATASWYTSRLQSCISYLSRCDRGLWEGWRVPSGGSHDTHSQTQRGMLLLAFSVGFVLRRWLGRMTVRSHGDVGSSHFC